MGKFVVAEAEAGYKFVLKANNGQVLASSDIYASEHSCLGGVESVRKNSRIAKLEDRTEGGYPKMTNPKFEVYNGASGEYRFRLKARNGEILAVSEGYASKPSCLKGVANTQKNAPQASVVKG